VICVTASSYLKLILDSRNSWFKGVPEMAHLEVIASELRLIAAIRRTAAELGAPMPRIEPVDELLDKWIAAPGVCRPRRRRPVAIRRLPESRRGTQRRRKFAYTTTTAKSSSSDAVPDSDLRRLTAAATTALE
jgi:hypothetical protein